MYVDTSLPEKDIIIKMINLKQNRHTQPISRTDVQFSTPQVIDGVNDLNINMTNPNHGYNRNTMLMVEQINTSLTNVPTSVSYRRIDLDIQRQLLGINNQITTSRAITQNDYESLKNDICALLNIHKNSVSFSIQREFSRYKITVTALRESLLYLGEVYFTVPFNSTTPSDTNDTEQPTMLHTVARKYREVDADGNMDTVEDRVFIVDIDNGFAYTVNEKKSKEDTTEESSSSVLIDLGMLGK